MHMTAYFLCVHTVRTELTLFLSSLLPAVPLTVYVWQQHVCSAARRGCDGVWDGEGDCGGEWKLENLAYYYSEHLTVTEQLRAGREEMSE